MAMSQTINKEVTVNALYFRSSNNGFRSFPKRMEVDGQQVNFQESGLQMLIQRGQNFIKLFDMTDGEKRYKLRLDPTEHTWTLLSTAPASRMF